MRAPPDDAQLQRGHTQAIRPSGAGPARAVQLKCRMNSVFQPILRPGRNCWRVERARRVAFLVDGADYFSAFRAAAIRARRSIFILAWDFDSRTRLLPGGADDGFPEALGDFLNALAKRSSDLAIYVLDWDFAVLYAADRELLPLFKLGWRTHRRLHFRLDAAHPAGASHHQKVVVIDDALAFVGGIDLTHCRWDTPAHRPDDPRRRHPDGNPCPPFHDIQMAVDGDAAAALGELARERWRRATGRHVRAEGAGGIDPWPPSLVPDLTDVDVGIARTEPAYKDHPEIQEIKRLYLDIIEAARGRLYIENQYFSAASIAAALVRRLREQDGPEVVVVSRRRYGTWLEESVMGSLRARLHPRLRDASADGRYAAYYPHVPGLEPELLNVHAKLLVGDDDWVTVGSANLSNRSMGFDTECNLVIEAAGDARIRSAIRALRHRMLSEHLGTSTQDVAEKERETATLRGTIAALDGAGRTLLPLTPELPEGLDSWVPDGDFLDLERPVAPEQLVTEMVPPGETKSAAGRLIAGALLLAALLGLAAAWRWTALGEWLDLDKLARTAARLDQSPLAPLAVLAAYVIGGLLSAPVSVLIAVTVIVFGPWFGFLYASAGSLVSAAATFVVGRLLGRKIMRRLAGRRVSRLSEQLGRRGMLSVVTVRILPIAPFSLVNVVAGATHIQARDFLLGTLVGMAPGILVTALFVDRVAAAIKDPGPGTFAVLAVVVALVLGAAVALHRRLRRRGAGSGTAGGR